MLTKKKKKNQKVFFINQFAKFIGFDEIERWTELGATIGKKGLKDSKLNYLKH